MPKWATVPKYPQLPFLLFCPSIYSIYLIDDEFATVLFEFGCECRKIKGFNFVIFAYAKYAILNENFVRN